jgi:hypothetical protein
MIGRALARARDPLVVRWVVLRGLGVIYVSVFASLAGTIQGMIGPRGIQPAVQYFATLREAMTPAARLWSAPSLLWLSAGDGALTALWVVGLVAALALTANLWPRLSLAVAAVAFLSFVAVANVFAAFQSDGMLLEASLAAWWLAPRGLRPGLGAASPPSRAALWLLRFEWFRIYFQSGVVKLVSGETQWRDLTAMVKYYENGPLPTWIGWYVQQCLPRGFHLGAALTTLAMELVLPWTLFLPLPWRRRAFVIFSLFQIGIIATANYAFLNYLVLLLGVTLLCEQPAARPARWREIGGWIVAGGYMLICVTHFLTMGGAAPWPARLLAPFRPRFDWDLWFASLEELEDNDWVLTVAQRLVDGEPSVVRLFGADPFGGRRPIAVRAVKWQYWFTTPAEKRAGGAWWRRELVGVYAPPWPPDRDMQAP